MGIMEGDRKEMPKEKMTAKADKYKMSIYEKSRYMIHHKDNTTLYLGGC
jgi:hypothetical protein